MIRLFRSFFWMLLLLAGLPGTMLAQPGHNDTLLRKRQLNYHWATRQHLPDQTAEAAYLLGKTHRSRGELQTAHRYFLEARRIWERLEAWPNLLKLYVQLVGTNTMLERPAEEVEYGRRIRSLAPHLTDPHDRMTLYAFLAGRHLTQHAPPGFDKNQFSLDSALHYYRLALPLAYAIHKPKDVASILNGLGQVESQQGWHRQALVHLHTSLRLYRQAGHWHNTALIGRTLAMAYLAANQPGPARRLLDEAQRLTEQHHLSEYQHQVFAEDAYVQLFVKTGDWQGAYRHQLRADSLVRASIEQDRNAAISRLNVEFETEKKENSLRLQREQLRFQRWLNFATGGGLLLALGAAGVLFWLYSKNRRLARRNAELMDELAHRVKNNLQTMVGFLSLHRSHLPEGPSRQVIEESLLRVQAVARLHQYLSAGEATVSLPHLLPDVVEGILTAYGYGPGSARPVVVEYDLAPLSLPDELATPLCLIINELITNACKYAFLGHPAPLLKLGFYQEKKDRYRLHVADNGPGMASPAEASTAFGLRIITLLVRQLRGKCHFSTPPGTAFTLSFAAPVAASFSPPAHEKLAYSDR